MAKNHNNFIFDIWGTPVPTPFYREGQIWCARADARSTLTDQISSECVHCVGFRWPKTILGKCDTFVGSRTDPLLPMRASAIAGQRCTFTCVISSQSAYSVVLWRRKPPFFSVFWTSAFSDVASWHQSQKVERGSQLGPRACSCTTKTFGSLTHSFAARGR